MKYKLWYSDDEVRNYHPIVEKVLNLAINKLGKSTELEVKHHPEIPGLTEWMRSSDWPFSGCS